MATSERLIGHRHPEGFAGEVTRAWEEYLLSSNRNKKFPFDPKYRGIGWVEPLPKFDREMKKSEEQIESERKIKGSLHNLEHAFKRLLGDSYEEKNTWLHVKLVGMDGELTIKEKFTMRGEHRGLLVKVNKEDEVEEYEYWSNGDCNYKRWENSQFCENIIGVNASEKCKVFAQTVHNLVQNENNTVPELQNNIRKEIFGSIEDSLKSLGLQFDLNEPPFAKTQGRFQKLRSFFKPHNVVDVEIPGVGDCLAYYVVTQRGGKKVIGIKISPYIFQRFKRWSLDESRSWWIWEDGEAENPLGKLIQGKEQNYQAVYLGVRELDQKLKEKVAERTA